MRYAVLDEVIFTLRRERDAYEGWGAETEAEKFDGYSDAVDFPLRHLRYGTRLTSDEIEVYYRNLLDLTAPDFIAKLLPFSRQAPASRALFALANVTNRLRQGKPARKLLGIFG